MSDYSAFFLMKPEDVKRYAVEVLHFFQPEEETDCAEIGDGNINYVFQVRSRRDGRSVIVKQADKLLRSSGRPLDLYRNKIEAETLMLEARLAPKFIPEVYHYDETMAALSMEDISAYKNLRKELAAGRVYGHLSENLSDFLAQSLLPTTDLVMDRQEKKKRVKFFTNPELCDITEDLVLTEPYLAQPMNPRNKNIVTPGNEAFTSMRARGAMVTDIAILVVAADDGIMPQTIESINHAKAAGIPLVVAINKMDVHGANPDRIKQQLTEYGLVPEEWGGETIVCPISAKTGEGVDKLLENLVLLAEILELKANPNRAARGTVIEARMDKGRGPIMTVLVQNGTLHQGDIIIAGTAVGRVRTMTNDKGQRVTKAGPSIPVEIAGMSEVPSAGDKFNAVADERMARELVEERKQQKKDAANAGSKKVSLDDLFSRIQQGEMKDFNIIVKADVQGSAEAVKSSLEKLSNDEVRVQVIHSGVGAINESDVMLAATSNAIIVGFNVRPDAAARDNAARSNVEIRMYRVIYDCINEIEAAMKGMLAPKFQEQIIGHVEIRQTFKVSKVGTVCGGYVTDGKIVRNSKVRVVRDNIVVFEGDLASLRRFKDDVKEVAAGYECGLQVDKYNDVKVGDVIEVYVMEEIKQ